jgi:hypothetical protein
MKYLISLTTLLLCISSPAKADRYYLPTNPVFQEECGACHVTYPPQMLDANAWRAVMANLPNHFKVDASLDEKRRTTITELLVSNAGGRKTGATVDDTGKPILRITETARFIRKHHEVRPAVWQRASIKSPANCSACHPQSAAGDYSEHAIRIPK